MRLRASDVREPSCRDAKTGEGGEEKRFQTKIKKTAVRESSARLHVGPVRVTKHVCWE